MLSWKDEMKIATEKAFLKGLIIGGMFGAVITAMLFLVR